MKKIVLKPAIMICPIHSGMVSYGNHHGGYNSNICTDRKDHIVQIAKNNIFAKI
jgi:hypothetical protein